MSTLDNNLITKVKKLIDQKSFLEMVLKEIELEKKLFKDQIQRLKKDYLQVDSKERVELIKLKFKLVSEFRNKMQYLVDQTEAIN